MLRLSFGKVSLTVLVLILLAMMGCSSVHVNSFAPIDDAAVTSPVPLSSVETDTPAPALVVTAQPPLPSPTGFSSASAAPPTNTPHVAGVTPKPSESLAQPAETSANADQGHRSPFVIDHGSIADFERIPDEYITKAAQIHLLYRGASVGNNINEGLDCLANNFVDRRPHRCDSGLATEQILFDPKYDRSNWTFEPHSPPPNPNPGWWDKIKFFVDRVSGLGVDKPYDVVSVTFDYVDLIEGANMDDQFFQAERSGNMPIADDLSTLEAAHPELQIFWWTSNLARAIGTPDSESFNRQMREYALTNHKILFDMADIESHAPDGAPCFDKNDRGIPAICQDYTDEKEAGHLNPLGQQRVVKALWVLMARIAGWDQ